MRAKDFTKPVQEKKIIEMIPKLDVGRVGTPMGAGDKAATYGAAKGQGSPKVDPATLKTIKTAQDKVTKKILRKGSQLSLPTQGGKETEFDIDDVKGDMVTLTNPMSKKGEPSGFVYDKKSLEKVVKAKADKAVGNNNAMSGKVV